MNSEFGYRVQRRYRQRIIVEFLSANLHAVDQVHRGVVALPRNRECRTITGLAWSSTGTTSLDHAGGKGDQLHEIASVERQANEPFVIYDLRQARIRSLQQTSLGLNHN